jgi:uncharacterized protein (TIGR02145 family)
MKLRNIRSIIIFSLVILICASTLLIQSCKKDQNNTIPINNTGASNTIGIEGGTIMVDDPESSLYGSKIIIPAEALMTDVNISIEAATANAKFLLNPDQSLVAFQPEGLLFRKPVEITIPVKNINGNLKLFSYNTTTHSTAQMPTTLINLPKGLISGQISKLSTFTAHNESECIELKMINIQNEIGARIKFNDFSKLPILPQYQSVTGFNSVTDFFEYSPNNSRIILTAKLYQDDLFWNSFLDEVNIQIERFDSELSDLHNINIYKDENPTPIYSVSDLTEDEIKPWLNGEAIVFHFDEFTANASSKYFIKLDCFVTSETNVNTPYQICPELEFNNMLARLALTDMDQVDLPYQGCIDTTFVQTTGNHAPIPPFNPYPVKDQIDVSRSTTISWECNDPESDSLVYDIFLDDGDGPILFAENHTEKYFVVDFLLPNTNYIWYVIAKEALNPDKQATSPLWRFTTIEETYNNSAPEINITVSSPIASVGDNIVIDASACVDNFDPIEYLKVRWDWDNDGMWDTDWQSEKALILSYQQNGNHVIKFQIIDTEGLISETKCYLIITDEEYGTLGSYIDDRDGEEYKTVQIYNQIWFAENLKYNCSHSYWYDNQPSNGDTFGRLYKYDDALVMCPEGWHLSSDDEWMFLELAAGLDQNELYKYNERGTDQAQALKETSEWENSGSGTNTMGFSALPGGYREGYSYYYDFSAIGSHGFWWSTQEEDSPRHTRTMNANNGAIRRGSISSQSIYTQYYSVRCIKD